MVINLSRIVYSFYLIITTICTANYSSGWHAYDYNKPVKMGCENVTNAHSNTNFTETVKKFKLWHIHGLEATPDDLLYGIDIAMQTIWDHQHPTNCSDSKFLIVNNYNSGFGSVVHVNGASIGLAMNLGRVLLENPVMFHSLKWQVKSAFCSSQKKSNLECYYQPWSSCTIYDALGPDALDILKYEREKRGNPKKSPVDKRGNPPIKSLGITENEEMNIQNKSIIESIIKRVKNEQTVIFYDMVSSCSKSIPFSLMRVIDCSPMRKDAERYWWRAISSTYILRPNRLTSKWLNTNRLKGLHHKDSAINIYIRRGDKAREMNLIAVDAYAAAASRIWQDDLISKVNSRNISSRKMFLASEDPHVQLEMEALSKIKEWELYTASFFKRTVNDAASSKNGQGTRHDSEYLSMIHTLHTAMFCSGYVCTMASNFCRLIDELRTTIGGKLRYPYADLSNETCTNTPCIGTGVRDFQWR